MWATWPAAVLLRSEGAAIPNFCVESSSRCGTAIPVSAVPCSGAKTPGSYPARLRRRRDQSVDEPFMTKTEYEAGCKTENMKQSLIGAADVYANGGLTG
jgi:hypothetical protein